MGGRIAVGIIDGNGDFETIEAWTNPLPKTFKSEAFARGDITALNAYLDFYRDDRSGEGYGPTAHVPSEYGYILFDIPGRTVVSAQDYTGLLATSQAEMSLSESARADELARLVRWRIDHDEEGNASTVAVGPYASFAEMKRDPDNDPFAGQPDNSAGVRELVMQLPEPQRSRALDGLPENFGRGMPKPIFYDIGLGDWNMVGLPSSADGLSRVRDYIDERHPLTAEEKAAWNERIAECLGDMPDDDAALEYAGPKP